MSIFVWVISCYDCLTKTSRTVGVGYTATECKNIVNAEREDLDEFDRARVDYFAERYEVGGTEPRGTITFDEVA